jgi:hypothetical protein
MTASTATLATDRVAAAIDVRRRAFRDALTAAFIRCSSTTSHAPAARLASAAARTWPAISASPSTKDSSPLATPQQMPHCRLAAQGPGGGAHRVGGYAAVARQRCDQRVVVRLAMPRRVDLGALAGGQHHDTVRPGVRAQRGQALRQFVGAVRQRFEQLQRHLAAGDRQARHFAHRWP